MCPAARRLRRLFANAGNVRNRQRRLRDGGAARTCYDGWPDLRDGAECSGSYAAAPYPTAPYTAPSYAARTYAAGTPYAAARSYAAVPYAAAPATSGLYGYAPQAGYPPRAGYTPPALYASAPPAVEAGYTLDAGDRLRIVVFGQDGLTNSYVVGAGGYIDMPLIGCGAGAGHDHRSTGRPRL